jgi:hypothetical protein
VSKRRHKGREVPLAAVAGARWITRLLPETDHHWNVASREVEQDLIATCSHCPARVRLILGESPDKWMLAAFIEDAGTGVWRTEVDWLMDRVMADFDKSRVA